VPILPEIPRVELDVVAHHEDERRGFLDLRRLELVVRRGEQRSQPFRYDVVDRRALDAAIIAAHHETSGKMHVYLRSAIRPPIAVRADVAPQDALLWELPAGLIEPGEEPHAAAARELEEELGFAVSPEAVTPLGPRMYPAPGFIGEKHFYFHVRVDPTRRKEPGGDGSPLEEDAMIISVPLEDALAACAAGEIRDAKTELALRRLADVARL
jgi:ADP-ribose pyrophosphatase